MFMHNKKLMYTVRVAEPNPGLATLMLEQFGGPQGELAAAMRYFTQGLADEDVNRRDMLMDIATEELSHLEVIGSIVAMLNRGAKGKLAEAAEEEADLYASMTSGGDSTPCRSSMAAARPGELVRRAVDGRYIDSIGDPACDLRSNIAAEARAKIVYERLINVTDDPGIKDALSFLMTREVAHQKSFEKALYAIPANFPPARSPAGRSSPTNITTCPKARATPPVPGTRASSGRWCPIARCRWRWTAATATPRSRWTPRRARRWKPS